MSVTFCLLGKCEKQYPPKKAFALGSCNQTALSMTSVIIAERNDIKESRNWLSGYMYTTKN